MNEARGPRELLGWNETKFYLNKNTPLKTVSSFLTHMLTNLCKKDLYTYLLLAHSGPVTWSGSPVSVSTAVGVREGEEKVPTMDGPI